jgi:hypothetical protein
MELTVTGEIWTWRGPAPHHFVTVPVSGSRRLHAVASSVTYGWGMIPVSLRIGDTSWTTALWPKDGQYIVPLKLWVRRAEGLEVGDTVTIHLSVQV